MGRPCSVVECGRPARTRGYCQTHYVRWLRNGHPTEGGRRWVIDHDNGDRTCNTCDARKPAEAFSVNKRDSRGLSPRCRDCRSIETAARYMADLDASRAAKARNQARRRARLLGRLAEDVTRESLRADLGDECFYCGVDMDFTRYPRGRKPMNLATVDHILPLSKGGEHTRSNTTLCCLGCNLSKGAREAPTRAAS